MTLTLEKQQLTVEVDSVVKVRCTNYHQYHV